MRLALLRQQMVMAMPSRLRVCFPVLDSFYIRSCMS